MPTNTQKHKTVYFLMLMSIVGYLSKYGFSLLLSNHLTPRRFGEFSISIRILGILTTLALLGTNISARRFLARFIQINDSNGTQTFIQWNMRVIHYSFFLCVSLGLITYVSMHVLHVWHVNSIQNYHMVLYMLWVAPVASLFALLNSYLLCADHTVFSNFLNNIKNIFYTIIFLIFFIFFKAEVHVFTVSIVLFVAISILLLIEIFFIINKTPALSQHLFSSFSNPKPPKVDKTWPGVSLRLALNNLMFLIVCTGDLFIVQLISPKEAAVAQYAAVLTIASAIFIIPQNLYAAIKSKISRLMDTEAGRYHLEQEIRILNRYTIAVILILGLNIIFFSHTLLAYFGPIYIEAQIPLIIVTIGFMIGGYVQAGVMLISYSGNEKIAMQISIVELIALIIPGIILTYMYGIMGTSYATSFAIIIKAILFHVECYKKMGIRSFMV